MSRWVLVVLLSSGCAFSLSGPEPDRPRHQMPDCDTSKALVALDGVMAATMGVIALSIAGDTEPAVALLPASIGAIYAAGAAVGNSRVNKCRKARGEWEASVQPSLPPDGPDFRERYGGPPVQPPPAVVAGPPVAQQPPVTAPPQPVAAPPAVAPQPQPPAATPAAQKPAVPAKPQPKPQDEAGEDEWGEFWKEVP